MGLFSEKRNYNNAPKYNIDAENTVDIDKEFKESFLDQWHLQTYTANSYSRTDNLHDEFEKELDKIEKATGKRLDNPFRSAFGEFFVEDVFMSGVDRLANPFGSDRYKPENVQKREDEKVNKFYSEVEKIKKQYPNLEIRSLDVINEDIKKQALEYYQKVNDGRDANYWGDFLGNMAGAVVDPINATLSLITGGGGAAKGSVSTALKRTAAAEFLENSAIEALIQPSVYKYKKELNLPYSAKEAAINVVAAGVGGAVLGTAVKGAHLTSKQILDKFKKAEKAGVKFTPEEQAAAKTLEKQIEFDDWSDKTNLYGDELDDKLWHETNLKKEIERLNTELSDSDLRYATEPNKEPLTASIDKYLIDGEDNIYYNFVDIHNKAGLIDVAPEHFTGKTTDDIYNFLGLDKKDTAHIKSPIEDVIIKKEHVTHLVDDNEYARRGFLNYTLETIKNPNLIIKNGNKNKYIKLFNESSTTKPHMQIVKTAEDGSFYVTNYRPKKNQVVKELREGQVIYDLSNLRDANNIPSADNIISQEPLKVKDFQDLKIEDLENSINESKNLSPEEKITEKKNLESLKEQEKWDNEILDCIVEFGNK